MWTVDEALLAMICSAMERAWLSSAGDRLTARLLAANGHFALPVTLVDGTNQLIVSLITPTDVVASTSVTIVLDKIAPPLALTKPKDKDTIDGTSLTVEGKAEPGATSSDPVVSVAMS